MEEDFRDIMAREDRLTELENEDRVVTPLQSGVSKPACCRDCGEKVTTENKAGDKIDYEWNKEGTQIIGSTIKAICKKCFYKVAC
jgi:hypothetical protein